MAKQLSVLPSYSPMLSRRKIKNPDPDRHYRWVRDDPDRIRFLSEELNYRLERDDSIKTGDKGSLKGVITGGGDVLMSCPKEEFLSRERERERLARAQLDGPRETFKTEAQKHGVETEDSTKMYQGSIQEGMSEK